MKLLFREQTIEFEQVPFTDEVIESINRFLGNDFYFSHLIVDGEQVLESPEQFLTENLADIVNIEVIAIPVKEFVDELLLSAEEYTERVIPHITILFNGFYTNPTQKNWIELSEILEGIQWLLSMIETIDHSIVRPDNWTEVTAPVVRLKEELGDLEEALENTDTVLIADMLQYEILPVFEGFITEIKQTIDTVGTRHDLS